MYSQLCGNWYQVYDNMPVRRETKNESIHKSSVSNPSVLSTALSWIDMNPHLINNS